MIFPKERKHSGIRRLHNKGVATENRVDYILGRTSFATEYGMVAETPPYLMNALFGTIEFLSNSPGPEDYLTEDYFRL